MPIIIISKFDHGNGNAPNLKKLFDCIVKCAIIIFLIVLSLFIILNFLMLCYVLVGYEPLHLAQIKLKCRYRKN